MDYKEKYEHGLECIQEILSGAGDLIRTTTLRKRLQPFFPELQENEGERMKKAIIHVLYENYTDAAVIEGVEIAEIIAWLEKQGEQKLTLPKWKYKKDNTPLLRDSLILNKYGCVAKSPSGAIVSDVWVLDYGELAKLPKEELEKQGEKKSADKIEPKFKPGDFITNDYCLGKVIEITNDAYLLDTGQGIPFSCEHNAHLWSINDAKEGDVLTTDSFIFIFKSIDICNGVHYYCHYEISKHEDDSPRFGVALSQSLMGIVGSSFTHYKPATKEQRDLLFQKMKEAGYEWDSEKKELKKIEQNPAESTKDYNNIDPHFGILVEDLVSTDKAEPKFKAGNWYQCTKDFFGKGVTFDKNTAYYCAIEGCLQNEYGCHIAIVEDLYDNFKLWSIEDAKDGDVLVDEDDNICLYLEEKDDLYWHSCIYIGCDNCLRGFGGYHNYEHTKPATKEQRDMLFQKMKEAGYEWDSEKKELTKLNKS